MCCCLWYEDDARTSNTRIAHRKRAITQSTIKSNLRSIIECCNNTHRQTMRMQHQPEACASDLGDGSHVTCYYYTITWIRVMSDAATSDVEVVYCWLRSSTLSSQSSLSVLTYTASTRHWRCASLPAETGTAYTDQTPTCSHTTCIRASSRFWP